MDWDKEESNVDRQDGTVMIDLDSLIKKIKWTLKKGKMHGVHFSRGGQIVSDHADGAVILSEFMTGDGKRKSHPDWCEVAFKKLKQPHSIPPPSTHGGNFLFHCPTQSFN